MRWRLILWSKTILLEIRELWRERCILVMMGICLLCLFVCWEDSTDIIFPFLTSRVMLHTYLAADIALLFCCLVFQIVELRHHPRIVILGPALVRVWAPDWVPCHFDVERGSAASWHNCSRWSGWPQCWPHHGADGLLWWSGLYLDGWSLFYLHFCLNSNIVIFLRGNVKLALSGLH